MVYLEILSLQENNKLKEENKLNMLLIVLSSFLGWEATYHTVIKSVRHGIIKENNFDS